MSGSSGSTGAAGLSSRTSSVTATVTRTPMLGNLYREGVQFTGWIEPGHDLSIWQAIEVTPENVDTVF